MSLSRLGFIGVLAPSLFLLSHATACSDDDHDEDGPSAGLADVVYENGATDEGLEEMLGIAAKTGDKTARLTAPANGAKISDAPSFEWSFGAPTGFLRAPSPRKPLREGVPFRFTGLPNAHAHGTPMNGNGYLLVLSTSDNPKLLRAFTTATTFKPSADVWARVKKDAKGTVRAVVTTAAFENNKVLSSGGPFEGQAITFEIQQ